MTQLLRLAVLAMVVPLAYVGFCAVGHAQTEDTQSASLSAQVGEVLRRAGNGHSPTAEEIAAIEHVQPLPDSSGMAAALPLVLKALENPDGPVRTYALTVLVGVQSAPTAPEVETASAPVTTAADASAAPAPPPSPPATLVPANYKPEIAKILTPAIPQIAAHLTEESQGNRVLAATILGGFTPDPPAAVYPPLLAYLKRDDAIGAVGLMVVSDLLQIGPVNGGTAEAISRYLRRSDQTGESRSNLVDAISTKPNQSQALNKALLDYLSSDDPGLRARLLLSLPQLDLAPDVFADTKARVVQIAGGDQENLQVITAAKAVADCWTATRMTSGCPAY